MEDIEDIETEPNPYEALRFVSSVTIALGWAVIIGGWGVSILGSSFWAQYFRSFLSDTSGILFDVFVIFIVAMAGLLWTIAGVFVIAAGQIYLALLDIRNDMHATMRLVRRFGLASVEQDASEP